MDAVSEVLSARAHVASGFDRMVGASLIAHAAVVAIVILGPASWWGQRDKTPEVVMQVSLGGPEGPQTGGLSTLSARAIQQAVPVETKRPIEAVRPPADRTPEMVDPTKATPRKLPDNKVDAKDPKSRTPTKGAEVQKGTAVAETGARGQGFGLSGGAGGAGGIVDVVNFCCPEYLIEMRDFITKNWSSKQGVDGTAVIRFVIQRDGRIVDAEVERTCGNQGLDFLAKRAVELTKLRPLPAAYDQAALTIHLPFEYRR